MNMQYVWLHRKTHIVYFMSASVKDGMCSLCLYVFVLTISLMEERKGIREIQVKNKHVHVETRHRKEASCFCRSPSLISAKEPPTTL